MKKIINTLIIICSFIFINTITYGNNSTLYNSNTSYYIKEGEFGYAFDFIEDNDKGYNEGRIVKKFRNINNIVYGPFDDISNLRVKGKNFAFRYMKNNNNYININGKEYGPFSEIYESNKDENIVFTYTKGISTSNIKNNYINLLGNVKPNTKNKYININGKEYGPYFRANLFRENHNNEYALSYRDEHWLNYIKIDGKKKYGPLDKLYGLAVSGKNYIFGYTNGIYNETADVNINGKNISGYANLRNFYIDKEGNYIFSYMKDYIQHIVINGKEIGNFDYKKYRSNLKINDKLFKGENNLISIEFGGKYYLIKKGELLGPYYSLYNLKLDDTGYSYVYKIKVNGHKESYVNVNGKEYGPYTNNIQDLSFDKKGNFAFIFSVYNDEAEKIGLEPGFYLNHNGKNIGLNKGSYSLNLWFFKNNYVVFYGDGYNGFFNVNGKLFKGYHGNPPYELNIYDYKYNEYYNNRLKDIYLFIDGKKYGLFDYNFKIHTGKNRERFIYTGKDGNKYLYFDGNITSYGKSSITDIYIGDNYKILLKGSEKLKYTTKYKLEIKDTKNINSKTNPKIDKILNKFFYKIDKKGKDKSKIVYEKLINKIDSLISSSKNNKTKDLLNYIKDKVLEKIK